MKMGPLWMRMLSRPSLRLGMLTNDRSLPCSPGVYAIYRDDEPVYVGKAGSLKQRVWKNHCGRGAVMTGSAFRRNVAEFLRVANAADIKARRYQPTSIELERIRSWIDECELRWITCETEPAACELEKAMKAEWVPPLTKR